MLALMLASSAYGKLPQKGDHVQVIIANGVVTPLYEGTVTDIKEGFLCMNCSYTDAFYNARAYRSDESPHDICLGIGSIIQLQWIEADGKPI